MSHFIVTGGTPLNGAVRIGGAKNASFKIMIAAILGSTESRLLNFSHISDVKTVGDIIEQLGGKVRAAGERALFIDPTNMDKHEIDGAHGAQGRFSTIFIGPLLARFGKAVVPAPGGDKIGKRPLERHFEGLEKLGATLIVKDGLIYAETSGLKGTTYTFEKNTHTGTETLILAAVMAEGTTILENAAEEPEIDDLILFLNNMGAHIRRKVHKVIEIEGVKELHGAIHKIMPDRNEAVSYACAAIATKGDVIIENAKAADLTTFLEKLDEIHAGYEVGQYGIRFFHKGELVATDLTTEIHPGFMTDWQPLWAILATQCSGKSVIHETVMQKRFQYVHELEKMGVSINMFNPPISHPEKVYNFNLGDDTEDAKHAIQITGPALLRPGNFEVLDLRHGATLIIAAMIAEGQSKIHNISHVDRGYEKLDQKLRELGADIQRVED